MCRVAMLSIPNLSVDRAFVLPALVASTGIYFGRFMIFATHSSVTSLLLGLGVGIQSCFLTATQVFRDEHKLRIFGKPFIDEYRPMYADLVSFEIIFQNTSVVVVFFLLWIFGLSNVERLILDCVLQLLIEFVFGWVRVTLMEYQGVKVSEAWRSRGGGPGNTGVLTGVSASRHSLEDPAEAYVRSLNNGCCQLQRRPRWRWLVVASLIMLVTLSMYVSVLLQPEFGMFGGAGVRLPETT
jgi:hypothetical protein